MTGGVVAPGTRTELSVLVPEADPVLQTAAAVAGSVPPPRAHVSVLAPWMPGEAVTPEALDVVAGIVGARPAFSCTFASVDWFGDAVAYLRPAEPAWSAFEGLTRAVWEAFPEYAPYGGQFPDAVNPHLTVGKVGRLEVEVLRARAEAAERLLPLVVEVTEVVLLVGNAPGMWPAVRRFPLGVGSSGTMGAHQEG